MTFLFLVFQQGFEKHNDEIFVTRILVLENLDCYSNQVKPLNIG